MVTPGDIDQADALSYSDDETATVPFAPIGDAVETEPEADDVGDDSDGSSAIPGFGVTAGAAGVAAYAATKALGETEQTE